MEIIGYLAALIMGFTLGSIGGGGSILTVPILVYLMGVSPVIATGYSLLIVGSVAAFGSYQYFKQGLIDIKSALLFAIPSIIAVYLTRLFIMPAIPDVILESPYLISKDLMIMVFFASLMVFSALMMLRNAKSLKPVSVKAHHPALIVFEGAVIGVFTGILGAGGGFLIIPALVLLMGMPMKRAVGASLLIIALKSLIGFIGDLQNGIQLQMPMLLYFFLITAVGMWAATRIAHKIDGNLLQKTFAYFTLAIAFVIFIKEFS